MSATNTRSQATDAHRPKRPLPGFLESASVSAPRTTRLSSPDYDCRRCLGTAAPDNPQAPQPWLHEASCPHGQRWRQADHNRQCRRTCFRECLYCCLSDSKSPAISARSHGKPHPLQGQANDSDNTLHGRPLAVATNVSFVSLRENDRNGCRLDLPPIPGKFATVTRKRRAAAHIGHCAPQQRRYAVSRL